MKKKVLFLIPMALVVLSLFLLSKTGMKVHIAMSVIGLLLLIAYTITTKKEWKIPALEIIHRLCYAIALITGVVLMNVRGIPALSPIHKISAVLFVVLLIVVEVHKSVKKSK